MSFRRRNLAEAVLGARSTQALTIESRTRKGRNCRLNTSLNGRIIAQGGKSMGAFVAEDAELHGEEWGLRYVEKLCDVHRAEWRAPGQRFFLY